MHLKSDDILFIGAAAIGFGILGGSYGDALGAVLGMSVGVIDSIIVIIGENHGTYAGIISAISMMG